MVVPGQQLDDALTQLVQAELIFRRGTPPDAEYTFKHALVQDAAYSTLLRGQRQQLHARIAATLEDQFPETVATQPALVALALRGSRAGGEGGRPLAQGRSAGVGALGDDGSGRPVAEGVEPVGRIARRPLASAAGAEQRCRWTSTCSCGSHTWSGSC